MLCLRSLLRSSSTSREVHKNAHTLASLFLYVSRGASVARKRVRTCALSVCKCEYICAYMHVYAKVRVFTHAHTFNHKCTFATLAGARTYKHTLTHTHTHMHARARTRKHTPLSRMNDAGRCNYSERRKARD